MDTECLHSKDLPRKNSHTHPTEILNSAKWTRINNLSILLLSVMKFLNKAIFLLKWQDQLKPKQYWKHLKVNKIQT